MKELNGFIFVLFLVFVFNRAVIIDASEFEIDPNHDSNYLLKRRSRSLDSQGRAPDSLWHTFSRRTGLDVEGRNNEFYPDYGHPNSNAGSNHNQGNVAETNKQYGWGYNNQNNGGFNSQGSGSFNNQGNPSSRPNQSGGQKSSYNKPNQSNGGFGGGQSSSGSNSQNSGATSSQSNGGSSSTANNGGGSTTQRLPLNIILNENTMDNSTIRECIQTKCPSTNEYNPVCGDDNITYQNPSKFKCAQLCQSGVKMSYRGSCVTTPAPN